jgi:hypothetical protein
MRKTAIALLALGLAAVLVSPASATKFWTETFTYTNQALGAGPVVGSLNPTTGWITHSSTFGGTPTDIQIISGVAVGNHANAPDDSRMFGVTTGATDKTYSCFNLNIPTPAVLPMTGTIYFAHFKDNIAAGTQFTARVFGAPIVGDNAHYQLGIAIGSAGPNNFWATPLTFDTWYVVATMYDAATGGAKLWVNPAGESSLSIANIDGNVAGRLLGAFALRQSTGNWMYQVDDISVGTTFDETCKGLPTPVRTETWGRLKTLYR